MINNILTVPPPISPYDGAELVPWYKIQPPGAVSQDSTRGHFTGSGNRSHCTVFCNGTSQERSSLKVIMQGQHFRSTFKFITGGQQRGQHWEVISVQVNFHRPTPMLHRPTPMFHWPTPMLHHPTAILHPIMLSQLCCMLRCAEKGQAEVPAA